MFNRVQQAIVAKEIETLLNKGVIKPSCHEPGEFISPIFLRPKPDGTYRMILNLRAFNEFVQYRFQPYQRPRNDFLSKGRPPRSKYKK